MPATVLASQGGPDRDISALARHHDQLFAEAARSLSPDSVTV
jgi:hypothetical protein